MKTLFVMLLLVVAFSAVVLAERSIQDMALDLAVARDDCGTLFSGCDTSKDCCEGYVCHLWCKCKG
uniref:Secretory peptide n=1 Tax=Heteropoda venatoria TaxID=152925 RepID=A0A088BP67_HETVE|nr:secretory peptide [Heteropoda venatoria]